MRFRLDFRTIKQLADEFVAMLQVRRDRAAAVVFQHRADELPDRHPTHIDISGFAVPQEGRKQRHQLFDVGQPWTLTVDEWHRMRKRQVRFCRSNLGLAFRIPAFDELVDRVAGQVWHRSRQFDSECIALGHRALAVDFRRSGHVEQELVALARDEQARHHRMIAPQPLEDRRAPRCCHATGHVRSARRSSTCAACGTIAGRASIVACKSQVPMPGR